MTGLAVRDLSVRFGRTAAVDHVDLLVPEGSVTAVLGPSGCGKSTLLRAIAGLEVPSTGSVSYDGADLGRVPVHRRGFALMFQDGQLFPHQSVARNVGYPLTVGRFAPPWLRPRVGRAPAAQVRARVEELLELVGLVGYADRMPATLSGGERQRVALARSLAVEPRVLLLDEPLSALDRDLRERLAGELHDILRRAGTTAVLVTHDHDEAFAVADRMAVMRDGALVQVGDLDQVWAHPADPWTARFLGYAEVLEGEPATVLRALVDAGASWTRVALRRSALAVDPHGPLAATVLSARVTPEQVRLELDVDGLGRLAGVADPAYPARAGERVRLAVRTDRVAPLP